MSKNKVFITGGTGFIGQALTRELAANGWQVVALVRHPDSPRARILSSLGVQCARGDILERESMREAMNGADIVIHNAGQYEVGLNQADQRRMQAINVDGTRNVLGLALETGVQRTLYISSVVAFGGTGPQPRDESHERTEPCRSTYEQTKTDAHTIALQLQDRGLPLIIACPNSVIGPNDHSGWGYFLRLYLNRRMPPIAWSPHAVHSLVEVNDLALGIVLAAEKGHPGETYIFAGEARTIQEHLAYWYKKPGALRVRFWMPANLMAISSRPLEPIQRAAGLPALMSGEGTLAIAAGLNYSSRKAQKELGWTHQTAEEMWLKTIEGEIELMRSRSRSDLVSRLKPVDGAG